MYLYNTDPSLEIMPLDVFNAFRDAAAEKGIIFYYNGYFSQNIIAAMGDALRQKLQSEEGGAKTRKVFSSFIEMAQNIVHYSAEQLTRSTHQEASVRLGAVAVGRQGDRFFVLCGNVLDNSAVDRLREKLESVRAMSAEEIKKAYREQLRNDEHGDINPDSKGAGLGLLTLARDAAEPIQYAFVPVENELYCQFYLRAVI